MDVIHTRGLIDGAATIAERTIMWVIIILCLIIKGYDFLTSL
uniref:Uncharacterized protein n=1 Tax=Candidatus Methanogaster sp. ANME-2c ERB4 TaxID=2759911 RepID=A0A7G9YHY8_9EURY|nr:hypothetical protein PGBELJNO_00020 [Methanosarcinales archaeon ANME-2c ERB4]